jgi:Tfp pilus assembly protein PilZ
MMTYTADQIEKHTIVTRLSVSIYKMPESQLLSLLKVFEQNVKAAGGELGEPLSLNSAAGDDFVIRQMIIARLFILIKQMDKDRLLESMRLLDHPELKWVREYPRLDCFLLADFAADGKAYRGIIRDISAGGVFIETSEEIKKGQHLALCYTLSESNATLPIKIKGRVTRVFPNGIGVQYENITQYQQDIINSLIQKNR